MVLALPAPELLSVLLSRSACHLYHTLGDMVSHAINLYLFPQNGFHFGRSQWFPLSEFAVVTSAILDSIAPGQYRLGSGRANTFQ